MLSEIRDYEYLPETLTENPAYSEADLLWTKPQAVYSNCISLGASINVAKR